MFLKGECADFPDSWSDRMWGPDDLQIGRAHV